MVHLQSKKEEKMAPITIFGLILWILSFFGFIIEKPKIHSLANQNWLKSIISFWMHLIIVGIVCLALGGIGIAVLAPIFHFYDLSLKIFIDF